MSIRWDSESDWKNNQDSSGTTGRNGNLKQGYSRDRPDLSTGLVGYWPLHDASATDYSGNGNHGSLNGGVTTGVAGKGGLQAMSFDGNDDYIYVNSGSVLQPTKQFSVSLWIRADDYNTSDSDYLIARAGRSDTSDFFSLFIDESGSIVAQILDDSVSNNYRFSVSSPSEVKLNQWTQIVVTKSWDGNQSEMNLFIDGSIVDSSTDFNPLDGQPNTSNPIRIGENPYGSVYFNGSMGDVRIYNRPLTETEIKKLYRWGGGDFARPPSQSDGGVSYWPLDGNADDSWSDNNGSTNSVSSSSDGVIGSSLSFDGSDSSISIDSSELDIAESKSVSAWFKMDGSASSQYQRIFQTGTGNSNRAFEIWVEDENGALGEVVFRLNYDQSQSTNMISQNIDGFDYGRWYHVCCVYDYANGEMRIYVNGIQKNKSSYNEQIGSETDHYIGNWADGGTRPWNGKIDDLRVYSKSLSPEEIFELYRYGTKGRDLRRQLVNF